MSNESVPFSHWIILGVIMTLVFVLGVEVANSAERGDRGFITENTNLCHVDSITPNTISGLSQWAALIARLEAAGGAVFLSEEDQELGAHLAQWCSSLATGYPVVLVRTKGDYALAVWHESLNFGPDTFIIRLDDFHTGGLEL